MATYLFALILSVDAFALENQEKENLQTQQPQISAYFAGLQSQQSVSFTQHFPISTQLEQAQTESQDMLFTEIGVYTLIIMVYSLYWLRNN